MRTSTLRHKEEIQELIETQDAIGNQMYEWAKVGEAWAAIEPLKGEEYFAAATIQAQISHKVTMRPPGIEITPAHRIIFGSRIFEIESVINVEERNRELVLMCVEKIWSTT